MSEWRDISEAPKDAAMGIEGMVELADKLARFVEMPEWQRFYMDKEQGAACVDALRRVANDARA